MKNDGKDVGFYDDAIFALSNLIAAQNHAQNTFNETKNEKYLAIAKLLREIRSRLLYKLTKKNEGELYCLNKHALGGSLGLKECGDRMIESGDLEYAKELYADSLTCEKLFKLMNLITNKEVEDDIRTEKDIASKK